MKKKWEFHDPATQQDLASDPAKQMMLQRLLSKGLCVSLLFTVSGCGSATSIDLPTTKTAPPTQTGELTHQASTP